MKTTVTRLENLDYLYTCDLGDIRYTVRGTGWSDPYYFLFYHEQDEERAFTGVPYDDIRFFAALKWLESRKGHLYFVYVLINDRMERVDWEILKKTMSGAILSQHPIWCVVANFMRERPYGPGGRSVVKGGTKHFLPGAKVYCYPPMRGDGYETVQITAPHRVSHRYITAFTRSAWLEKWRVELVYRPILITKLIGYWDWTPESKELAELLVAAGKAHARPIPGQLP